MIGVEAVAPLVAAVVREMPLLPIEVFYTRHENQAFELAYEGAEKMLAATNRLDYQKHIGLAALDEYNGVSVPLMEFMLVIGIEYGRRLAAVAPSPNAPHQ